MCMHLFSFPHCTVCHDFDSGQGATPFNIRLYLKIITDFQVHVITMLMVK